MRKPKLSKRRFRARKTLFSRGKFFELFLGKSHSAEKPEGGSDLLKRIALTENMKETEKIEG